MASKIISNFHFYFQIKNGKIRNWQFSVSIKLENKMILSVHVFNLKFQIRSKISKPNQSFKSKWNQIYKTKWKFQI